MKTSFIYSRWLTCNVIKKHAYPQEVEYGINLALFMYTSDRKFNLGEQNTKVKICFTKSISVYAHEIKLSMLCSPVHIPTTLSPICTPSLFMAEAYTATFCFNSL